jgi:hypothetical protein
MVGATFALTMRRLTRQDVLARRHALKARFLERPQSLQLVVICDIACRVPGERASAVGALPPAPQDLGRAVVIALGVRTSANLCPKGVDEGERDS